MDSREENLADADFVKEQPCNLYWIMRVLKFAFSQYTDESLENIALAIGNTGSGKSTML